MTPETETNVNETLKWIGETADQSKDFIIEQAPLYAQELIAYHFWSNAIQAAAFGIATAFLIRATIGCIKKHNQERKKGGYTYGDGWAFIAFTIGVVAIFSAMLTSIGATQATKAKLAPRVVIVEHIRNL